MEQQSNHVMRFYGNIQFALETIALKQITFLHMDKLNDPFDLNIFFETDFCDDYQTLINYVQKYHQNNFNEFKRRSTKNAWEKFIKDMEINSNKFRESTFIFSTSEISKKSHPKDSVYMWSHYGNGHRGIAIEFDTSLLTEAVLAEHKKLSGSEIDIDNPWVKIDYVDEFRKVNCEDIFKFVIRDIPIIRQLGEKAWLKTELAEIIRE